MTLKLLTLLKTPNVLCMVSVMHTASCKSLSGLTDKAKEVIFNYLSSTVSSQQSLALLQSPRLKYASLDARKAFQISRERESRASTHKRSLPVATDFNQTMRTPEMNKSAKFGGPIDRMSQTATASPNDKSKIIVKAGGKQFEYGIPVKMTQLVNTSEIMTEI